MSTTHNTAAQPTLAPCKGRERNPRHVRLTRMLGTECPFGRK
jgi:hypothetical protein